MTAASTQRRDFIVGLFMLVAVGVVVGMGIVTSGLGEKRISVYMRAASAQALTQDTRILLGGLTIGRVAEISPVVDSLTGAITFVGRLSLQETFANGSRLVLPAGTRAVIAQPNPIQPAWIDLVLPDRPVPGRHLQPGDTIASERPRSIMDALDDVLQDMRGELQTTLAATRTLLARSTAAVESANSLLASNGPRLTEVLAHFATALERTDSLVGEATPRVGPLADSVLVVLGDAHRALAHTDSLVTLAGAIASENRGTIKELSERLLRAATVLEHFSDQVSRRPVRLFTGVRPPPVDTSRADSARGVP